jgi:hypothetical protein
LKSSSWKIQEAARRIPISIYLTPEIEIWFGEGRYADAEKPQNRWLTRADRK